MKWRILISILLLLPVTYVNAQDPDIGIEVLETLYFGNYSPTAACNWAIARINKIGGFPNLDHSACAILEDVWYATEVRLYYISNGSNKTIKIYDFEPIPKTHTLTNTAGNGQLTYDAEGAYWNQATSNQSGTLSPDNPEAIYYIGGAVQFDKGTPAGIYTNNAIQITLHYEVR